MSANKQAIKFTDRNKSVDLMKKKLPMRIGPVMSEMRVRSRFDSHTQSSLMKRKKSTYLRKSSSSSSSSSSASSLIKCTKDAQDRAKVNVTFGKLSGICKRRNSIVKQSKNMQTLKMIFKRAKDRHASVSPQSDDIAKGVCQQKQCVEYSLVLFQDNLIIDVSRDLKKYAGSPTERVGVAHDEPTRIVYRSEKHAENSHVSPQIEIQFEENSSTVIQGSLESISDCSENRLIVDVKPKIQSNDDEEEEEAMKKTDSNCEIEVLHHELSSGEPTEKSEEDLSYEDRYEIETRMSRRSRSANANIATNRSKSTRKLWVIKKAEATQKKHINADHACHANLRDATNLKIKEKAGNNSRDKDAKQIDQMTRMRSTLQRNQVFANQQRTWRPPGINRASIVENMPLTQSMSQKSARSAGRFIVSTKSKQASNECADSTDNESTMQLTSANQSKMLMKENRDPFVDRVSKICNHFAETKQRQKLQNEAPLPKRRRSITKMVSRTSSKSNDVKLVRSRSISKSRSHYWQTRLVTPKSYRKDQNGADQYCTESTQTYNKRSRPSEVIHALKEIINSVKEDEDVQENAANVSNDDVFHREDSDSERRIANRDTCSKMTPNDELHFTKDNNVDRIVQSADFKQSFQKSVTTQTESNFPMRPELNPEKRPDENSEKISKSTQTEMLCHNKNVIEIGCNTTSCENIYRNAAVSCDLINSVSVATNIDPIITEDIEIIEDKSFEESKNLPCDEGKDIRKVFNTKITSKLKDHVNMDVPVETTNNFVSKIKETIHKEDTDKCDANNSSVDQSKEIPKRSRRPSLIYDFDATFYSSEELAECIENDAQYQDTVTSELTIQDIPSDVIAAFELAAERARNLQKAVMIYQESLMSRESARRNETIEDNRETLRSTLDKNRTKKKYALLAGEGDDKMKREHEAKCHFLMINNDFDGCSTCSSSSGHTCCSLSDQMCELESCVPEIYRDYDHFEVENLRRDNVIPSQSERAITKLVLNENSNVSNVKSLVPVHRIQGEHTLEIVKFNDCGDGGHFMMEESANILTLPTIEEDSFISRENLFLLICCVVCTVVFWCLQFSFRCNSAA